ncbi:MAG: nickel pincer cofactor biosynthesis protein LarC [Nitrospirae bacterium]|nr:nickel pincer cofactor biosynthesis protein LarC [Nitrospirota bacterium]
MMRLAYFDCSSGISGDMILGALIDAGLSPQKLEKKLSCLLIRGYKLNIKSVKRAGFKATKFNIKIQDARYKMQDARKWKDIEKIIKASTLSNNIKQKGLSIFKRLFEAEAKVHGEKFDRVHLHELGAVDCIIDIFGALIGFDILGINKIYSSPLNLGSGTVKTEHGTLPVPAPATIELLKGFPVYSSDVSFVTSGYPPGRELTTPTGAVIISSLAQGLGTMPEMEVLKIGIGAGSKDFKNQPNVLRVFIGQKTENPPPRHSRENGNPEKDKLDSPIKSGNDKKEGGFSDEKITVIETNIDDMNPQAYEHVMERLFEAGALDVFLTQIIMKKGRPGILLSVLCSRHKRDDLIKIILRETTSIGLRFYETERKILERELKAIETEFGKVNVKISKLGGDFIKVTPEYEDCKKLAKRLNIPIIDVMKKLTRDVIC